MRFHDPFLLVALILGILAMRIILFYRKGMLRLWWRRRVPRQRTVTDERGVINTPGKGGTPKQPSHHKCCGGH